MKGMTLEQFFGEHYLPYASLRKRSWRLDERLMGKYIAPTLGGKKLALLRQEDIEKWLEKLRGCGYAAASCNRMLATLKSALSLAEERGLVAQSPARGVRAFKNVTVRERYLSRAEGRALVRRLVADANPKAKALHLLMLTGARKSEILRSRWEYLDREGRVLLVPVSKSGKSRRIYLSDAALGVIDTLERSASPWLFPGRCGDKPLTDVFDYWKRIRRELRLGDLRVHDLRHTFASVLINSGHTLYEVQRLLGHAAPQTTMRYAHLAQDALLRAAATVSRVFGRHDNDGKRATSIIS